MQDGPQYPLPPGEREQSRDPLAELPLALPAQLTAHEEGGDAAFAVDA